LFLKKKCINGSSDETRLGEEVREMPPSRAESGGGGVKLPSIVSGIPSPRCPACFVSVLCCAPGAEGGGGGSCCSKQVKKDGPHQRGGGDDHGAARRAGGSGAKDPLVINGKVLVQKEQPIRFSPCSPGHIIEMCKYLGVNPDREFYLLSVVRRAVVAPFPQDWAVGEYVYFTCVAWCMWRTSCVHCAPSHVAPDFPGEAKKKREKLRCLLLRRIFF
jgi:hypothetical protein